jgi:hypothetical protein
MPKRTRSGYPKWIEFDGCLLNVYNFWEQFDALIEAGVDPEKVEDLAFDRARYLDEYIKFASRPEIVWTKESALAVLETLKNFGDPYGIVPFTDSSELQAFLQNYLDRLE